jgi:transposase
MSGEATRHVRSALKAMTVKTTRTTPRAMAQLMRMGWFRPVHVRSICQWTSGGLLALLADDFVRLELAEAV